jgi:hypothetical protein
MQTPTALWQTAIYFMYATKGLLDQPARLL